MFFDSTADTVVPLRRLRLRFFPLVDKIWRLYALLRLILPLPVTRKRLAAARLVLIFGTFHSSGMFH